MTEVSLDSLQDVGENLNRPECVLCTSDGAVIVSDWSGGVTRIGADGTQQRLLARNPFVPIRPNGFALQADGSLLLANLGDDGGVWRLFASGAVQPFLVEVEGAQLPPCNFVLPDKQGRTWVSVSTRIRPRAEAYRPDAADGFIAVVDDTGARVVADGLGYTNEVQVHPGGDWLYFNETFARRTSRMKIRQDGSLGSPEIVAEFGAGMFPDGLCFDTRGGLWVVSPVSNRVVRISSDGSQTLVIDDSDTAHTKWVEEAFLSGKMGREHLDSIVSVRLRSTTSIAFGGRERRVSYLGCLLGDRVVSFESPVAGVEPVHWHWRIV